MKSLVELAIQWTPGPSGNWPKTGCHLASTGPDVAQNVMLGAHELVAAAAASAGAAALAAALQLRAAGRLGGARIGLPLTGGNVDAALFATVLDGS